MKKSDEHLIGIQNIIDALSKKYPEHKLGYYVEHYESERNNFIVILSNNTTISINRFVAQDADQNKGSLTDDCLNRIIKTHKSI
ncbi:MAG: hypothetical protein IJK92_03940 [Bacteroidales bacterium]|nr:hypothetical protein [Bacteroidales bacterium]